MTENTYTVKIAQRLWCEWLAWLAWLFLVVFTFQNAVASGAEFEPRAATILWITEAVLLIGGAIVYFLRRQRLS